GNQSTTTQAGVIRGTPAYMAPERFFGTPAAITSDVYEVAVVFFMMLVGKPPWDGPQSASGRLQPRHPSEAGARLPARLATVLLKAMSTRPDAPPQPPPPLAQEVQAAAIGGVAHGTDPEPRHTAEVILMVVAAGG